MRILVPLLFVCLILQSSCKKDKPDNSAIVLHTNVIVIDKIENQSQVKRVDSSSIDIDNTTSFFQRAEVGSILVSGPCSVAEKGFLRRIIAVQSQNNVVRYSTVPATLDEVIAECNIDVSYQLSGKDTLKKKTDEFTIGAGFEGVLDELASSNSPFDKIELLTSLRVSPTFHFVMKKSLGSPLFMDFSTIIESELSASFNAKVKLVNSDFKAEKLIDKIPFKSIVFLIGGVPVVVTPKLELIGGADLNIEGSFEYSAAYNRSDEIHAIRQNGVWSMTHDVLRSNLTKDLKLTASVDGELYVKAQMAFCFYDLAEAPVNPYLKIGPKLHADCPVITSSSNPLSDCNLNVDGCIAAGVDVNGSGIIPFLSHTDLKAVEVCTTLYSNQSKQNLFFNLTNPMLTLTELNTCYMSDINAYGSKFDLTFYYDQPFNPQVGFDLALEGFFSSGTNDYDYVHFSPSLLNMTYNSSTKQVTTHWCVRFGNSSYVDNIITVSNADYTSKPISFRLYKPAGANKTDTTVEGFSIQ